MPGTTIDELKAEIQEFHAIRNVPQFLLMADIDQETFLAVHRKVKEFKLKNPTCTEIDVIVNSGGGQADDAYRIIRAFRKNFNIVNIIVPWWVKSAATLLSLGGTNIIMGECGEFGPLDAQIGKEKDDSPGYESESALIDEQSLQRIETRYKEMYEAMYIRIYEHNKINIAKNELSKQLLHNLSIFFKPVLSRIDPYKLGENRRSLEIGEAYAKRILIQFGHVPITDVVEFVGYLVNGCPDHGYIIDYDIVVLFLPHVKKATHFGDDYSKKLDDLALSLIADKENLAFVDFIEPKALPAPPVVNANDPGVAQLLNQIPGVAGTGEPTHANN